MAGSDALYGVQVRHLSLIALVFQNSAVTLIMRYTVAGLDKGEMYLPSVVVLMSETLKAITCTYMLSLYAPERSLLGIQKLIYQELFAKRLEMMKLSIPALLYLIQVITFINVEVSR
jgi:UDP-sugar transporter A1/2/3